MKQSLIAAASLTAAISLSTGIGHAAQIYGGSTDFEGETPLASYTTNIGDCEVKPESYTLPSSIPESHGQFSGDHTKILVVDAPTNAPLTRTLLSSGSVTVDATTSVYIDTLFKGTPAVETPQPTSDNDKLLVYAKVNGATTNLCVYAKDVANGTAQEFVLTSAVGKDEWHRIVIVAKDGGAFQLFLDGYDPTSPCSTSQNENTFYSLTDSSTVTSVAFAGNGSVDDFVVSDVAPDEKVVELSWPTGYTPVSYAIGSGAPVSIDGSSSSSLNIAATTNATVYFTFKNADDVTKTMSGNGSALNAADATFEWADYLGAAVAGAYTIDDANDLDMLRKGVDAGLATTGVTFKQTADIDMTSEAAFAGIGTYAAVPSSGVAFTGTYDGQGYKIKNIDFTQRNYGGVFNQVNGGTIQNLTVSNITCNTFSTSVKDGEWGGAIVGNAGNGATLKNLVAEGDFGTASIPCSHNVAGISVRLSRGNAKNTLVQNCTNNATLHGTYTKIGGICALTQRQDAQKDYAGSVVFDSCVNNGDIIATANSNGKNPGVDGIAGIVGYTADNTVVQNCSNTGSLSSTYASAAIGEIVGKGAAEDKGTLTDNGGNSGDAAKKLIATPTVARVSGFQYATFDNGVATTVTTLVKDTTYLLERDVAASETPVFTLAAAGDTIAFDTALGYTFAGTVASGVEHYSVTDATSGTVTTYSLAINQYNVTFVDEDGTTILKAATAYGYGTLAANVEAPADPTKDATAQYTYTFAGWSPAIADVTADATYTATYTPTIRKYTVSWDADGGSLSGDYTSGSVDYGTTIVAPTATKAATVDKTYIFAGWTPAVAETVTGDLSYTATWNEAARTYTVTWTDHSGTVKEETLAYGATPTAPETAPVSYTENGNIYTGTWPTPSAVSANATYAAVYVEAGSAIATVITIADAGATTNEVGTYSSLKAAVDAAPAGSTIVLLADDNVSFAGVTVTDHVPSNGSIVIDKNLTIDGCGHTVTGVSNAEILNATGAATPGYDMAADLVNGSNLLGFFVKSGDVTFKNLTLTEFGDTAYVNKFGYTPIQTAAAYTDDLVLENVNIDKFNRTAVCVRGGTLSITGGTITANAANKNPSDHFQQPVEIRGGTATIDGLTVSGDGYQYADNGGGAIVAWAPATLNNVVVEDFTGIGVWSDGPAVAITGDDTSVEATGSAVFAEEGGSVTIAAGDFAGALAVDSDPNSGITVNGGTFDQQVPEAFAGTGLAPTTIAEDGKYTVNTARTVTFDVDGSTTEVTVANGEPVAQPTDPVKDGYGFTGWTLNGVAYDFTAAVTEDITLVAAWTAVPTDEPFSDGTTADAFSIPAADAAALKELCGVADLTATVNGQDITYAQAYALGLINETTGAIAELPLITIEFENGQPVVKMDGTAKEGYTVTCHLYARDSLTDEWSAEPIANADYGEELTDPDTTLPASRFYKVTVTIADAQ